MNMVNINMRTIYKCSIFFASRRRHTIWPRDLSSDVCSSDLKVPLSYLGNEETEEDKRSIYYQSDVFLIPNDGFSTGYYFLLKNNLDEELFEFLNESIQLITNFGIGGDRSTGAGQITQIENDFFEWGFDSDVFSNLSLLIPSDDEEIGRA